MMTTGSRRVSGTATGAATGDQATLRMKIGGMSCSFCTNTIRKAYERVDGVHEFGVSLAHEEGLVRYDPRLVGADELRRTLEQVGYTYRDPDKVRSFEEDERELRTSRNRLLVAASFAGLTLVLMFLGMEPFVTVLSHPVLVWVMFALALGTMFGTAWFVKRMAWASLRRGILNQHVLLEFGAFAGLVGGVLGLFVSDEFPAGHFFAVAVRRQPAPPRPRQAPIRARGAGREQHQREHHRGGRPALKEAG